MRQRTDGDATVMVERRCHASYANSASQAGSYQVAALTGQIAGESAGQIAWLPLMRGVTLRPPLT